MPRKKKVEEAAVKEEVKVTAAAEEKTETVKKPVRRTGKKAETAPVAEKVKEAGKAVKEVVNEMKAEALKPVKAGRKKALAPVVSVQSVMGGELTVDEIVKRVNEAVGGKVYSNFTIYIKTEENKAFYVADDVTGSIDLW